MRRPISHFVDLAHLATAYGLQARSFAPVQPPNTAETLADLAPQSVMAQVFDAGGRTLTVTAAMLRQHIAETVSPNAQHFASWLAVAHLRGLAADPEYLR